MISQIQVWTHFLQQIAQGQSNIAGNALWNSTGKALTTKEFESKYSLSKNCTCERPYSFVSEGKHDDLQLIIIK